MVSEWVGGGKYEGEGMINDKEREALMRLTMCARRECKMCMFQGFDSEVCYRIATDCMHILADALNVDRKTENSSKKPNNLERSSE